MNFSILKSARAIVLLALVVGSAAASAAGSWQYYMSYGYTGSGSPYDFTNKRSCSWNYTTSYGASSGVMHLYTANGDCAFSEQKVLISFGYSYSGPNHTVTIYHR